MGPEGVAPPAAPIWSRAESYASNPHSAGGNRTPERRFQRPLRLANGLTSSMGLWGVEPHSQHFVLLYILILLASVAPSPLDGN
jgi:hypothetical protein